MTTKKPIELKAANMDLVIGPKERKGIERYGVADYRLLKEAEELTKDFERITKDLEED